MRLKYFPIVFLSAFVFAPAVFAQKQAEIVVLSTYLRKEPDYKSEKLRTLEKGARVAFEKGRKVTGWTYVSTDGGALKGWILDITFKAVAANETAAVKPISTPPNPPAAAKTAADPPNPSPNPSPTPAADAPPENDSEVLQIETEEVSLNVRVVNAANRPVGNLRESAFRVFEDGVLQPVTSVSTAEVPVFNALVIDNSRSLRTQLSKVIEAGKIITAANKPLDESTVVRFVSSDKIEVVQNFTSKKALVDNALDNLFVEGGQTAIVDAVYRTAEMIEKYQNSQKKEDIKLRALILVTDGDDRGSRTDEKQLFELLRNSYVQIYAIGFTDGLSDAKDTETGVSRREKARAFLTRLAAETGGKVYFPESPDALAKIAAEISGELRTQYVVSYAPTNNARDGGFRQIRVEVTDGAAGEKRTAITRTGRNAGKP
ncbi:MAG: VWA domain-containing protein [Acidobacteria bacterium]|nr:VWA domain-containing protein [Acidobacteriota bacterium]